MRTVLFPTILPLPLLSLCLLCVSSITSWWGIVNSTDRQRGRVYWSSQMRTNITSYTPFIWRPMENPPKVRHSDRFHVFIHLILWDSCLYKVTRFEWGLLMQGRQAHRDCCWLRAAGRCRYQLKPGVGSNNNPIDKQKKSKTRHWQCFHGKFIILNIPNICRVE